MPFQRRVNSSLHPALVLLTLCEPAAHSFAVPWPMTCVDQSSPGLQTAFGRVLKGDRGNKLLRYFASGQSVIQEPHKSSKTKQNITIMWYSSGTRSRWKFFGLPWKRKLADLTVVANLPTLGNNLTPHLAPADLPSTVSN
jgi:hypothetical protein